jgi:hypothetical protein
MQDPNTLQPVAPIQESRPWGKVVTIAASFLVVLGLLAAGWWWQGREDPFAEMSGKIFLTLSPKDGSVPVNIYAYSITENNLVPVADDGAMRLTGKVSPDGTKFAWVAPDSSGTLQLFVRDIASQVTEQVTFGTSTQRRLPTWSPGQTRILSNSLREGADRKRPGSWMILITDLSGSEYELVSGLQPLWSPEGNEIVMLREDGIYSYMVKTQELLRTMGLGQGQLFDIGEKIGLSPDGTLFALSKNSSNEVVIFDVTSWSPFTIKLRHTISGGTNSPFWPVFSPDGKYMVVQWMDDADINRVWLSAYDTTEFKSKNLVDLSAFDSQAAFVTDWR